MCRIDICLEKNDRFLHELIFLHLFWLDPQTYSGSESLRAGGIKKYYCFVLISRVDGIKRESVNLIGNK